MDHSNVGEVPMSFSFDPDKVFSENLELFLDSVRQHDPDMADLLAGAKEALLAESREDRTAVNTFNSAIRRGLELLASRREAELDGQIPSGTPQD